MGVIYNSEIDPEIELDAELSYKEKEYINFNSDLEKSIDMLENNGSMNIVGIKNIIHHHFFSDRSKYKLIENTEPFKKLSKLYDSVLKDIEKNNEPSAINAVGATDSLKNILPYGD